MRRVWSLGVCIPILALLHESALADQTGSYTYIEKGFSGTMIVKDISACQIKKELGCLSFVRPLHIEITTVTNRDAHDCSLEAIEQTVGRISSPSSLQTMFIAKDETSQAKKTFVIAFTKTTATITLGNGDIGGFCGVNGSFLGRWKKKR